MLRLNNANVSYTDTLALKNISLHIKPGEKIAIIGSSGSGKTTLLRTLYDLVEEQYPGKINWRESNDLEPTFISTFSAEFYQLIRNHLHEELKHVNAGKENSYLQKKWQEIIRNSTQYRNNIPIKFVQIAE